MLETGDQAPGFTLPDQNGDPLTLSALRGETVVLYFYPRADTPGCTTQACGIRDRRADYEAAGVRVIGVSPDEVGAVSKFAAKYDLDFTLLADADHAVADSYGAWVEKSPNKLPQQRQGSATPRDKLPQQRQGSATPREGKKYMGVQRSTFIIDGDGRIAHVIPKASPKTHDDQVLAAVQAASA